MSRVIERSGAQVLPAVKDERATVTSWVARLCADADQRAKYPEYREQAGRLLVVAGKERLCGVRFWESETERCTKLAGHELEVHSNGHYAWGPGLVMPEEAVAEPDQLDVPLFELEEAGA